MHTLEPFYNWRPLYVASEDAYSPFFEREYSEFEFTNRIYDHYIHPQWDDIDSPTLFIKILFTDYEEHFTIIELLGEWNDCIHNDIMTLKRDVIDILIDKGIDKFILIGENVLNFHASDDCYYEEWFDDIEDGWVVLLNFRDHVTRELIHANIDNYLIMGGKFEDIHWRTYQPQQLFNLVEGLITKRIG